MISFTAEVFVKLLAHYNASVWPAQVIGCGLGFLAVLLALRPRKHGDRWISAFLAVSWLWVGVVFHILYFSTINFIAPVSGALFIVQALLIAWSGIIREKLHFGFGDDVFGWTGFSLILLAVVAFPLLDLLMGHGWQSVRVFVVASSPLTLFTFGVLLAAQRVPKHLLMIPVLWSLVTGVAAWHLTMPQDVLLPVAAIITTAMALWKNRRWDLSTQST